MAHRFPPPAEGRLEALIAEAYDRQPDPDAARLAQIAERVLARAPAPRKQDRAEGMPWWLVFLLVGGAAAAAWQAEETWRHGRRPVVEPISGQDASGTAGAAHSPSLPAPAEDGAVNAPGESSGAIDDSPVIYRREGE